MEFNRNSDAELGKDMMCVGTIATLIIIILIMAVGC